LLNLCVILIVLYCIHMTGSGVIIGQMRRERFIEELEGYAKQLEEFERCGDMAEIQKYLKKAQTLDCKLQAASDKVKRLVKISCFTVCHILLGWFVLTHSRAVLRGFPLIPLQHIA